MMKDYAHHDAVAGKEVDSTRWDQQEKIIYSNMMDQDEEIWHASLRHEGNGDMEVIEKFCRRCYDQKGSLWPRQSVDDVVVDLVSASHHLLCICGRLWQ